MIAFLVLLPLVGAVPYSTAPKHQVTSLQSQLLRREDKAMPDKSHETQACPSPEVGVNYPGNVESQHTGVSDVAACASICIKRSVDYFTFGTAAPYAGECWCKTKMASQDSLSSMTSGNTCIAQGATTSPATTPATTPGTTPAATPPATPMVSYEVLDAAKKPQCDAEDKITSWEECKIAANRLGITWASGETYASGTWSWTPPGCWYWPAQAKTGLSGTELGFNTATGSNDGRQDSLCREAQTGVGAWPNCTSCPADPNCTTEIRRFRDDTLMQCVAFCTGDEVPTVLGSDDPGNKTCASCPQGRYANHETHECVSVCPAGEAPNEKNACAVCKPPFSYADHDNKRCTAKCPPGKVPDSMHGNDCTTCGEVFPFADHERHACVKQCGPGKIGDPALKECRACESGRFANHKNLSCDTTCPEDHPYVDGLDCVMTCGEGKVPDPMLNKGSDEFICSYCPEGKFADHALHQCVTKCSVGYSPDVEGTLDTKYKIDCKRCPPGKFADHINKKCVVTCPAGTTENEAKRDCESSTSSA